MIDLDFDNQKLMFHPRRVAQWLADGRTSGPLYTEFELTNACNCRCIFCGVEHLVNREPKTAIDPALARRAVDELAALGNRSIMFSGHGEPLAHPEAAAIIDYAARKMSASVTTNGLLLDDSKLELLDKLAWIRFSINGCGPEGYARIHGAKSSAFKRVMTNLSAAVARKRRLKLPVTIGVQLVLLEENAEGVPELAQKLREIGVDYFSVKPYSQHPLAPTVRQIDYAPLIGLKAELDDLATDRFKVGFRVKSMKEAGGAKPYDACCGTHFLAFVDAAGDVWECNVFAGDDRFLTGNLSEESLASIWNGPRRQQVLALIKNDLRLADCRDLCRMHACNNYLWRLLHPWEHDDFI